MNTFCMIFTYSYFLYSHHEMALNETIEACETQGLIHVSGCQTKKHQCSTVSWNENCEQ
jgi:exonuclease I